MKELIIAMAVLVVVGQFYMWLKNGDVSPGNVAEQMKDSFNWPSDSSDASSYSSNPEVSVNVEQERQNRMAEMRRFLESKKSIYSYDISLSEDELEDNVRKHMMYEQELAHQKKMAAERQASKSAAMARSLPNKNGITFAEYPPEESAYVEQRNVPIDLDVAIRGGRAIDIKEQIAEMGGEVDVLTNKKYFTVFREVADSDLGPRGAAVYFTDQETADIIRDVGIRVAAADDDDDTREIIRTTIKEYVDKRRSEIPADWHEDEKPAVIPPVKQESANPISSAGTGKSSLGAELVKKVIQTARAPRVPGIRVYSYVKPEGSASTTMKEDSSSSSSSACEDSTKTQTNGKGEEEK